MNEFSVHFQLAPKLPSCPHLFDGRVGIPHSLLRSLIVLLLCLSWIVKLVFAEAFLVLWTNIAIRSEMIFLHWDFLFFHFFVLSVWLSIITFYTFFFPSLKTSNALVCSAFFFVRSQFGPRFSTPFKMQRKCFQILSHRSRSPWNTEDSAIKLTCGK